jgi:hypothetical protein
MANALNTIRDHARIAVTPRDVGLTLTVEVTAYDSGVINVNGLPSLDYASTIRVLAEMVEALRDDMAKRAKSAARDRAKWGDER